MIHATSNKPNLTSYITRQTVRKTKRCMSGLARIDCLLHLRYRIIIILFETLVIIPQQSMHPTFIQSQTRSTNATISTTNADPRQKKETLNRQHLHHHGTTMVEAQPASSTSHHPARNHTSSGFNSTADQHSNSSYNCPTASATNNSASGPGRVRQRQTPKIQRKQSSEETGGLPPWPGGPHSKRPSTRGRCRDVVQGGKEENRRIRRKLLSTRLLRLRTADQ